MTAAHGDSVNQLLQNLHAERVATWRPEDLQVNIDQRRRLVDGADVDSFVKVGDVLEPFSVPAVDGSIVELEQLLARGPVVVIFFRFAGCPACNIALPYYQRRLYPALRELGATLLALSPQIPDKLLAIKERHKLEFLVASDLNNELGARFGILYAFDEPSKAAALSRGNPIGDVTGTGTWELPMPTAIVIDGERVARFVEVSPDWLVRTEAERLIEVVRGLKAEGAELKPAQAVA
jgi:peroxiredoxin